MSFGIHERILSQNYVFIDLPAPYWMAIKDNTVVRSYKRHDTIYFAGDIADTVYLVMNGLVMLSRLQHNGQEIGQSIVPPRSTFGELEVLNQTRRDQQATCLSDCELCLVPASIFDQQMAKSAQFSRQVAKLISQRQRRSECRQAYLAYLDVPHRLAQLLLELAYGIGHETPGGRHFNPCLTHQDMATLIVSSRETVSSVMGEFRRHKIINFDRKSVAIIDEQAMANY